LALLCGIDEAGYGPLLGPLIVSGTAFRVPDENADGCLWHRLRNSCTRSRRRGDTRLLVADSKQVHRGHQGPGGLADLERAVLVWLTCGGQTPSTIGELLSVVAPSALRTLEEYPWYLDTGRRIPLDETTGDIAIRANAIRRDCRRSETTFVGAWCEVLPEGHFNRAVQETENKADVLLAMNLCMVKHVTTQSQPGEPVWVRADRLGGRSDYASSLRSVFPDFEIEVIEVTAESSRYRMTDGQRCLDVAYVTRGERASFPIALASLFSKYAREVFMRLFNDYWRGHSATLKPTAGYYTDAQRWLREASKLVDQVGIHRMMLVRQR